MDEHYHLFVADPHNDRVRHYSAFGRHLGDFGSPPPEAGDAGRDRPGVLDRPNAVARRGDLLFVACGEQPRRRSVQRFSVRGTLLKPLASRGDSDARFGAPRGLWADDDGLLVADTLHGCLQRFRGDGTFLGEWACAERGALSRPIAVLRRPDRSVLFVDRGDAGGVRQLASDGALRPAPSAFGEHCDDVLGLTQDARGRLYVLDHHGGRVVRFAPDCQFEQVLFDLDELQDDAPAKP